MIFLSQRGTFFSLFATASLLVAQSVGIQARVCFVKSRNVGMLALNPCLDTCLVNGAQNFLPSGGKGNRANLVSPLSQGNDAFPRAAQPF
jgi:hypothetical protein